MSSGTRMVALLRGVNVGGNKKLPMAELRALAAKLGWRDVATYVQSGNLVGTTPLGPDAAAAQLAKAIEQRFGFEVPVIARAGSAFVRDLAACPFADCEPASVHAGYAAVAPKASLPKQVAAYCTMAERVAVRGGVLWIDCAGGVARSKLTSAVLDREVGGTVTLRNLNSARAIAALVAGDGT
jgi:uncharacterized protein (DUF1697 family)